MSEQMISNCLSNLLRIRALSCKRKLNNFSF
jgi:hypothetical protein